VQAGELPRAYVIRKNRNVSEQSIIDYVADRVAPHKKLGAGTDQLNMFHFNTLSNRQDLLTADDRENIFTVYVVNE
jgi:hypothetical protein